REGRAARAASAGGASAVGGEGPPAAATGAGGGGAGGGLGAGRAGRSGVGGGIRRRACPLARAGHRRGPGRDTRRLKAGQGDPAGTPPAPPRSTVATARSYARRTCRSRKRLRRCDVESTATSPLGRDVRSERRKRPTGIADVFALKRAGCDPRLRQQQRRASPAVQGWLDFQRSQGGDLGRGAPTRGEEQGHPEPGDIEAGGV